MPWRSLARAIPGKGDVRCGRHRAAGAGSIGGTGGPRAVRGVRRIGALVLLLLAGFPAYALEAAPAPPERAVPTFPKVDIHVLRRDESLLEAEIRVSPGADSGRVLWTRIDVIDSRGHRVRSKLFGMGIGAQIYPLRFVNPVFHETYRIVAQSMLKPFPLEAERLIRSETETLILDDDLSPPAISLSPGETLERPDSWDTEFRWSVTDGSGLDSLELSLQRDGMWEPLPGEPTGSFLPVQPGVYRLRVRAEDADDERPGDRLKNERLSPVMRVFDDDEEPPELDVRYPPQAREAGGVLPVELLASDPSGVRNIRVVYGGEEYRPPTGDVYAQGEFRASWPLAFRLEEESLPGPGSFDPWTLDSLDGGFWISLQDRSTDGPAAFRFTLLSDPVTFGTPDAAALGHSGEDPYLSLALSELFVDLDVPASEFGPAPRRGGRSDAGDRPGGNRVDVAYRINRGPWVEGFSVEGDGQGLPTPGTLTLAALPDDEIQVRVVYQGEINAFFSEETKEVRVARAALHGAFSWEIVEHGPVELPAPAQAGVHTFTVAATDGDDARAGDASDVEAVYTFTVPEPLPATDLP